MDKLQSQSTSNTSSISQAAAVEALNGPQDTIPKMVAVYEERRDLVVAMLNEAPGLHCHKPEGAFYVFPSVHGCIGKTSAKRALITSDESFVVALLDEEGVAAVHGSAFMYPGHFRVSYATARTCCAKPAPASSGSARACTDRHARFGRAAGARSGAATIAMSMRARAMRAAGVEVISLAVGEPDFASPPHAIEAAHQARAARGDEIQPRQDGVPALKQAIQRKFQRDAGLEFALDEIMVGNGGKQVVFDALMATVDDGDEVIIRRRTGAPTRCWCGWSAARRWW